MQSSNQKSVIIKMPTLKNAKCYAIDNPIDVFLFVCKLFQIIINSIKVKSTYRIKKMSLSRVYLNYLL